MSDTGMTGNEHFREAERLLRKEVRDEAHERIVIATAQVHATLAQAFALRHFAEATGLVTKSVVGHLTEHGTKR